LDSGTMRTLLLASAAGHYVPSVEDHREAFEAYKTKFGKTYASQEEEESRFEVFMSNHIYTQKFNEEHPNVKLDVHSQFSDLTRDEFVKTYVSGYKPELKQMWGGAAYLGQHEYSGEAVPDSVDWSSKGAVTPIKNQGQCGSCWSFSATGSLEGAYQIATGKLVSVSEQQLVDCSGSYGNQGCNGGLMDDAFQYMEANAMCTESSYPYTAKTGSCDVSNCETAVAKGDVTGFKDVQSSEADLEDAVAKGPVSVAIEADKSVFQLYKSGVLTATCGSNLDHGVLVVGYGELSGTKYWKVKNSWGSSWGMDGYVLLEKGKGATGECGILSQPSYPVVSASGDLLI